MSQRVVAITGANRGLGLALVKRLASSSNSISKIILCSRDVKKGKEALESIQKEGKFRAEVAVAPLDMDSEESIDEFCTHIKKDYGRIHALVNNAGILIKDPSGNPEACLQKTAATNLFGVISLTERFLERDLIEWKGKILGVSSKLATSSFIREEELKKLLSNAHSIQDLNTVYMHMLNAVRAGTNSALFVPKFPFAEYSVLKRMLSIYFRLLATRHEVVERDLFVATLCPGWCKTDMGGAMATSSVESGTDVSYDLLTHESGANHPLQGKLIYKQGTGINV